MKDLRGYLAEHQLPGLTVEVTGGLIGIYEAILDEIRASQLANLLFMFTAVFLCSAVAFRSIVAGLLVLVPLILGNIITFAVMALTGVGLFIYTLPVSALGIGVGIDYSLYILSRLKRELAQTRSEAQAYGTTFKTAGRAVCYTAATVTAGVLTLCLSEMRFQALLGVMLGIIMVANMLSALFVLTTLVSLFKPGFLFNQVKARHSKP